MYSSVVSDSVSLALNVCHRWYCSQVAGKGFPECIVEDSPDGTLFGLYLLIAGLFLVVLTLVWVFVQKYYSVEVRDASHWSQNIVCTVTPVVLWDSWGRETVTQRRTGGVRDSSSERSEEAIVTCDVCDTDLPSEGNTLSPWWVSAFVSYIECLTCPLHSIFIAYLNNDIGTNGLVSAG